MPQSGKRNHPGVLVARGRLIAAPTRLISPHCDYSIPGGMKKRDTPMGYCGAANRTRLHFLPVAENRCSHQFLNWWRQHATGMLHLDYSSPGGTKISRYPDGVSAYLVPLTGLEPVRSCDQGILSPWCLPFHHSGLFIAVIMVTYFPLAVK